LKVKKLLFSKSENGKAEGKGKEEEGGAD